MNLLDSLERKFGKFTFPYLLITLLAGQVVVYFMNLQGMVPDFLLVLNARRLLAGDYWRIFSFMLNPLEQNPLFFAFFIYISYLTGSKLEWEWGEFRFSLYLGIAWLSTILLSFLAPDAGFSNFHIFLSMSMAFARVFPDFVFMIFFVLPVKAKYLGMLSGGIFALAIVGGPFPLKLEAFAALLPFLIFFSKDLVFMVRQQKRAKEFRRNVRVPAGDPFHRCGNCGRDDLKNPDVGFRYENGNCICEICLQKRNES